MQQKRMRLNPNRKLEKEKTQSCVNSQPLKAFMMYFIKLRTAKSNTEAFNQVNEDYYGLFGHYRYSDWNTFKRMTNYYNNKNIL
jgi:hypothetical protein